MGVINGFPSSDVATLRVLGMITRRGGLLLDVGDDTTAVDDVADVNAAAVVGATATVLVIANVTVLAGISRGKAVTGLWDSVVIVSAGLTGVWLTGVTFSTG